MKKIIITLSAILLSFCLIGCGRDQYTIEKEYWKAKKSAEQIFRNPHAVPPAELQRTVSLLESFIAKNAANKLAVEAEFNIAKLYIVKKDFQKGRGRLKQIMEKYADAEGICAEALYLNGNSFELVNKWGSALSEYKKIQNKYPATPRGLSIPLYIAQYYKVKHQPDKMITAYREAITHYKSLAEQNPASLLAYRALNLSVKCYMALKDWQGALDNLQLIKEQFKDKISADGIILNMALIYRNELKDNLQAKALLDELIKDYPNSRYINAANKLLNSLEK